MSADPVSSKEGTTQQKQLGRDCLQRRLTCSRLEKGAGRGGLLDSLSEPAIDAFGPKLNPSRGSGIGALARTSEGDTPRSACNCSCAGRRECLGGA